LAHRVLMTWEMYKLILIFLRPSVFQLELKSGTGLMYGWRQTDRERDGQDSQYGPLRRLHNRTRYNHVNKRTCSRFNSVSTRRRSDCSLCFIRANWFKTSSPQPQ